jgi:hypothetical protein
MTEPSGRPPRSLEVDVTPVGGGDRRRGGGRKAAALVGAGLALVVGVAVLGGAAAERADTAAPPASPGASGAPAAVSSPRPTPRGPVERLPLVPDLRLADAPTVVFHHRHGPDLERLTWSAGGSDGMRPLPHLTGVLEGIDDDEGFTAVASPDGTRLAIRGLGSFQGRDDDVVRIVTSDGEVLWSGNDAAGLPVAPIWSPDSRRVLVPGPGTEWRILTLGVEGVTELTIEPEADGREEDDAFQAPLAFSGDGRWLYATVTNYREPGYWPAARYSTSDGRTTPLDAFPTDGQDAPSALGRLGFELDPLTGRRAVGPPLGPTVGPTHVRVFKADGTQAFGVRLDTIVGLAWAGDGRLLALETDSFPGPSRFRLLPIDAAGETGATLLDGGPLSWASLVGAYDGHVLLAFSAGRASNGVLVVLLRLRDGATATLPIEPELAAELHFGSWRP